MIFQISGGMSGGQEEEEAKEKRSETRMGSEATHVTLIIAHVPQKILFRTLLVIETKKIKTKWW